MLDFRPEQLKTAIKNGAIQLDNYKITSDNRLIENKDTFQPMDATNYLIMNKNTVVAEFDLYFGIIKIYGRMPYDYTNINDWLDIRVKFSCARDVKEFF